jgi:DNA-binding NarL/FixJ family response regulator
MSITRKIKVFVADDSLVLRERLLDMLGEIAGVEVLGCAEDGLHAIECIRRIQMPSGTGLDVLKNIKRGNSAQGPTIIVFTNFPYPQYRKCALEHGAEFFFDKTTEFEKLRELFGKMTSATEPQPH